MQALQFEREALYQLPVLVAGLLGERTAADAAPLVERGDASWDAQMTVRGRRWVFEIKSSSSPGLVAAAGDQLERAEIVDALKILVVPYMTPAGAKAAADRGLNWIDLSGNASVRDGDLFVSVQGRPNAFAGRGRPSSAFAPKSSRVARAMLLDPSRWWRQKDLAEHTDLDPGRVSRVVRRLLETQLVEREAGRIRPRDPELLLDAWIDDYRFDRHDIITGHLSGTGVELARELNAKLDGIPHAFTGLPAAWALDGFARFRLVSVYVAGDPRAAAEAVGLRRNERGANVQLIGPDDGGVFDGQVVASELPCVSPVQVYLDLQHLPERAAEAAGHLRAAGALWHAA